LTLFDKIIADLGGAESIKGNSKVGNLLKQRGVTKSSEFERIRYLPRRDWEQADDLDDLVDLLTQHLKTPDGTMRLWPIQAAALRDLYDYKCLFAPIPVGKGKALISLLAPVILKAKRPMLLVPASLRDQTNLKVLPEMGKHWELHPNLKVVGYSEISLAHKATMLDDLQPDMILMDEAHNVKNKNSARTKRVRRYLSEHPDTIVIPLSGTMTSKTLMDYWQLLLWSHGSNAPMPMQWYRVQEWAAAIDPDVDDYKRVGPGALSLLCKEGETVREGYGRRLAETPGVIKTSKEELGTSLYITAIKDIKIPNVVQQALSKLINLWETPDGDYITEAVHIWRLGRQIALGFWYDWDPKPPKDWMQARRAWKSYVREAIKANKIGLDSELQVWNICLKNPNAIFEAWGAIKDSFKPNVVVKWVSDFAINRAAKWMSERPKGIVWSEHVEFAIKLSKKTGYNYFGSGKKAAVEILDHTGPMIASIFAHTEGKNLQDRYADNLFVSPPPSGKVWEQALGRTHREGQIEDQVNAEFFMYTSAQQKSFESAMEKARYTQETLGRQKLLYADIKL